jgi:hypothetical protein
MVVPRTIWLFLRRISVVGASRASHAGPASGASRVTRQRKFWTDQTLPALVVWKPHATFVYLVLRMFS